MGLIEVDDNGKWRLKGVEWKQRLLRKSGRNFTGRSGS